MNYQRIHNEIIARAKSENRVYKRWVDNLVYYEKHHILPLSMGGSNEKENLVLLTAREHFLVHWLLAKIYNNDKMWYAFNLLCKIGNKTGKYYVSFRILGLAREQEAKYASERLKGKQLPLKTQEARNNAKLGSKLTQEQKDSISASSRGKKMSDEAKKNLSIAMKGRKCKPFTPEHCAKLSIKWTEERRIKATGRKWSAESILKRTLSTNKIVIQIDLNNNYINEFPSLKLAEESTGILRNNISYVCNGKRNSAGGFIWKFKNSDNIKII